MASGLIDGVFSDIPEWGIQEKTCRKYGYKTGTFKEKRCHIAPYFKKGEQIIQKLRFAVPAGTKKGKFTQLGDTEQRTEFFGQRVWREGGTRLIVAEGEKDCLTVAQLLNLRWAVVSPKDGAGDTNTVSYNIKWLTSFDEVVFLYDGDEAGRQGARDAASLLPPGKARIAHLPDGMDATEMVQAGRSKELMSAIYEATPFRPDGIVGLADVKHRVLTPPQWGVCWPWDALTRLTYGIHVGQVITWGAGVGVGKTDVVYELIAATAKGRKPEDEFLLEKLGPETWAPRPVGVFALEADVEEIGKKIAGKAVGKDFTNPEKEFDPAELNAAIETIEDMVFLYDAFGARDWEEISGHIRFLHQAHGVEDFFLDNLTALMAHAEDERRDLDAMMEEISSLAQELRVRIHCISHLTTPKGTPHEEGGRVHEKDFTGSRAIARWSHVMIGIERNKQDENELLRRISRLRILKSRKFGQATGKSIWLLYDPETGTQTETPEPEDDPMFEDETEGATEF